jgi:hypothetical protein
LPTAAARGITCLGECQAIVDNYIALAIELGMPLMPDAWW